MRVRWKLRFCHDFRFLFSRDSTNLVKMGALVIKNFENFRLSLSFYQKIGFPKRSLVKRNFNMLLKKPPIVKIYEKKENLHAVDIRALSTPNIL